MIAYIIISGIFSLCLIGLGEIALRAIRQAYREGYNQGRERGQEEVRQARMLFVADPRFDEDEEGVRVH